MKINSLVVFNKESYKYFYSVMSLCVTALISSCSSEIDFRQTEVINGLVYKIKTSDPYSGKVSNIPMSKIPANLWPMYEGRVNLMTVGSATCTASLEKGQLLDGDLVCSIGKIKILEVSYRDGKKNGVEKYRESGAGNLLSEISWKNGLYDGKFELMNTSSGKIVERRNYREGKLNGAYEKFSSSNGRVVYQGNWVNGVKSGDEKEWDESGEELLADIKWINGKPNGVIRRFKTATGRYLVNYELKDGLMTGMVTVKGSSMADFKNGTYESVTENDERHEFNYVNGEIDGEHKYYAKEHYSLPQYLKLIDHYNHGKLDGISQEFDKNGVEISKSMYKDGVLVERSSEILNSESEKNTPAAEKDNCDHALKRAESDQIRISPASSFKVLGEGRLYFHSAPSENCRINSTFVIPGDDLVAYTEYNGWYSVSYINPKTGKDYDGWVDSKRLKLVGTIAPKNQ